MFESSKLALIAVSVLMVVGACTTAEKRYCARQAGAGDITCGPAVSANDWRNAR